MNNINNTQPISVNDDEQEDDYMLYKAIGDDEANFTTTFRSNTANTMRRTMHQFKLNFHWIIENQNINDF